MNLLCRLCRSNSLNFRKSAFEDQCVWLLLQVFWRSLPCRSGVVLCKPSFNSPILGFETLFFALLQAKTDGEKS